MSTRLLFSRSGGLMSHVLVGDKEEKGEAAERAEMINRKAASELDYIFPPSREASESGAVDHASDNVQQLLQIVQSIMDKDGRKLLPPEPDFVNFDAAQATKTTAPTTAKPSDKSTTGQTSTARSVAAVIKATAAEKEQSPRRMDDIKVMEQLTRPTPAAAADRTKSLLDPILDESPTSSQVLAPPPPPPPPPPRKSSTGRSRSKSRRRKSALEREISRTILLTAAAGSEHAHFLIDGNDQRRPSDHEPNKNAHHQQPLPPKEILMDLLSSSSKDQEKKQPPTSKTELPFPRSLVSSESEARPTDDALSAVLPTTTAAPRADVIPSPPRTHRKSSISADDVDNFLIDLEPLSSKTVDSGLHQIGKRDDESKTFVDDDDVVSRSPTVESSTLVDDSRLEEKSVVESLLNEESDEEELQSVLNADQQAVDDDYDDDEKWYDEKSVAETLLNEDSDDELDEELGEMSETPHEKTEEEEKEPDVPIKEILKRTKKSKIPSEKPMESVDLELALKEEVRAAEVQEKEEEQGEDQEEEEGEVENEEGRASMFSTDADPSLVESNVEILFASAGLDAAASSQSWITPNPTERDDDFVDSFGNSLFKQAKPFSPSESSLELTNRTSLFDSPHAPKLQDMFATTTFDFMPNHGSEHEWTTFGESPFRSASFEPDWNEADVAVPMFSPDRLTQPTTTGKVTHVFKAGEHFALSLFTDNGANASSTKDQPDSPTSVLKMGFHELDDEESFAITAFDGTRMMEM